MNSPTQWISRWAALAVTGCGYLVVSLLLHWSTAGLVLQVQATGPAPLDAQIGLTAAAAGWLVLTWLGISTLLALATVGAAGHRRPRLHRVAERVAPALVRRAAAALLGAGLGAGVAGGALSGTLAAYAGDGARPAATATAAAPSGALAPDLDRPADLLPGWTPDRPAPTRPPASPSGVHLVATVPIAGRAPSDEVVVRRGDTLWDIAARHLGGDASAAEVAAEWPRWHRANQAVIGPRPDHILPGLRLRPPAAAGQPDLRSPR